MDGWGEVGGSAQLILAWWEQQQSGLLSCFVLSIRHHSGGELHRGGWRDFADVWGDPSEREEEPGGNGEVPAREQGRDGGGLVVDLGVTPRTEEGGLWYSTERGRAGNEGMSPVQGIEHCYQWGEALTLAQIIWKCLSGYHAGRGGLESWGSHCWDVGLTAPRNGSGGAVVKWGGLTVLLHDFYTNLWMCKQRHGLVFMILHVDHYIYLPP